MFLNDFRTGFRSDPGLMQAQSHVLSPVFNWIYIVFSGHMRQTGREDGDFYTGKLNPA